MSDISSKPAQRSAFSVRDICYSGLFAAVIAIMAQISIPMPGGVPMTMQTFAITLAAVVLGAKLSTVSCVIYLLLGAVGVPVLANFSGGFDKFIGPTGGFLISFPLMGLTPPLFELPWYEHVSEIVGHLVWFWSIEIIRRDLRNRITHEPDPEIPLGNLR